MQRLITRAARKWALKEKLSDSTLLAVIQELELGKSVVDLGSGLFKVRVARLGQGKSGGYRTLIVYRAQDRAIVVYGFAKSETDNIDAVELKLFRKLAKDLLALSEIDLAKAITANVFYVLNEEINEITEEISDE
ncbi:MAG: type II toxin-antitoxin system RelE/ParE family toxin [Anaerolineae bacterium]|nr:type II toxin-antitoxin system RelE/ParE family toxin [Anaerolineae bacterium]